MKTVIVPAQITTVEDRVAGNLSMTQLGLITSPLLVNTTLYIVLPPGLQIAAYKIVILVFAACLLPSLAIRIKGKVVISWFAIFVHYMLRPQRYLLDKNDLYLRDTAHDMPAPQMTNEVAEETGLAIQQPIVTVAETIQVQTMLDNPNLSLHFKRGKKGGLDVIVAETN